MTSRPGAAMVTPWGPAMLARASGEYDRCHQIRPPDPAVQMDTNPSKRTIRYRLKQAAGYVGGVIILAVVAVVLLCGLKGCIVTVWVPPTQPKTYAIDGADGRFMRITFFPDRTGLIVYFDPDPNEGLLEAVLYKFRWGEYGKHYFWRVWNVSREGESPFGLRIAKAGAKPIRFSYEIVNKWRLGPGDSTFPPVGKSIETVFWFTDDAMKFAGMWLPETDTDHEMVEEMLSLLRKESE